MEKNHHNEVAIVGAGISGLLACKYVLSKGLRPAVFESRSSLGGVWLKTIKTTKLQTSKFMYRFSDYPWPSSVTDDFPTQHQTLDYLESYARHFDLLKHIKFNTKVTAVQYEGASVEEMESWSHWGGTGEPFSRRGAWQVSAQDIHTHSTQVCVADFVIICSGQFSDEPNIPEFPPGKGPEAFEGKVIHSKAYSEMEHASAATLVKGKRVTVVGLMKSALDITMECSGANGVENPCTVLYKSEHWNAPDHRPWGVPLPLLYMSRFSELMIHKPGEGFLLGLLATILSPLNWGRSKFVESYIKWKLPLAKYRMIPKQGFLEDLSSCAVSTVPDEFYDRVEMGSIVLKKSKNFCFHKDGVLVNGDTEPVKTDLVILATGFRGDKKLKTIFKSPNLQDCIDGSPNAPMQLYRECIHPRIPQLAIIGFSESIANLYTSEMRCRWLAELLDGSFKLPSIKDMEKDVAKWEKYMKQYAGGWRSCMASIHIWYNDELCRDMGWNPKRKKGLISEWFHPYGPMDYVSPS